MAPPTLCDHLQPLLTHLLAAGAKITYVGQPWTTNCRTWVYLDTPLPPSTFPILPPIAFHTHRGTHDGSETGFVCNEHNDAIMGPYIEPSPTPPTSV